MLSWLHLLWIIPISATIGAILMAIIATNNIDFYESVCTRLKIRVKKLHDDAVVPTLGSQGAAGADLYAYLPGKEPVEIRPHETVMIGSGVAVSIPNDYWGGVFARSGLASKNGLAPANKVGVVDPDYRGEVKVALHNHSDELQVVRHGDRIAQFVVVPLPKVEYEETEELDDTERGAGGFGHTGA